jgi:hypothetical protein
MANDEQLLKDDKHAQKDLQPAQLRTNYEAVVV